LDSCVAAALTKEALGKNKVLALILPCHSQKEDLADARVFAKKFGIKTKVVNLTQIYNSVDRILPPADRMSMANIRPRLRMIVLYYFAKKLNYLVCGTSNKSNLWQAILPNSGREAVI